MLISSEIGHRLDDVPEVLKRRDFICLCKLMNCVLKELFIVEAYGRASIKTESKVFGCHLLLLAYDFFYNLSMQSVVN